MKQDKIEAIKLHGVRQNNLKGFDLDIPVGQLVVVTGLSGAGKSSLVFETLHAEGQRRYVETFSPYTRQFLELLPEAAVDSIENIRPSIAIKQGNSVKTSRSNVGTMTELCDWIKVWFAHAAELIDPATGKPLRAFSSAAIWADAQNRFAEQPICICFEIERPQKISWNKILAEYAANGFTKIIYGGQIKEIEDFLALKNAEDIPNSIYIVVDRLRISAENRSRFLEAVTSAMKFGRGIVQLLDKNFVPAAYTDKLVSPVTKKHFRPATPALFSFNSPIGACPKCHGFGRVIELDWGKIIPDETKTIAEGVFAAFSGAIYGESQKDLMRAAKLKKIPTKTPWNKLTKAQQDYILDGDPDWSDENWTRGWYGVRRFFQWLESTSYKMHVRVFLSRFRAYTKCPDCAGTRFKPESLAWKFHGNTLPELYAKTVDELYAMLSKEAPENAEGASSSPSDIALAATLTRLGFLQEVGLGFLTLDRQSRTLSGGETQRVNLTACLGASLSNTLFILDEPSVGLHARDLEKMISILRKLVSGGNTVVVVEHDESVMRAADTIIEIGPRPGAEGGKLVYCGDVRGIIDCKESITGRWLSGKREKELEQKEATPSSEKKKLGELAISGVSVHNLHNFSCKIPLGKLVGLCGVSGSGKSTLLNNVLAHFSEDNSTVPAEDDLKIEPFKFKSTIPLDRIVLVDQSPVSKTPRSNPAVFAGVWTEIRKLLAGTPEAIADGLTVANFSYNSGDGRCPHCHGSGWETVEMQFLSDVFVPCPVCGGKRFSQTILKYKYKGKNATELLDLTISEALKFFAGIKKITSQLALLEDIGLGYLTLGQPLNTLSGGEAQRLKLVKFLGDLPADYQRENAKTSKVKKSTTLLLIDEPTTGLHREDIHNLIAILKRLAGTGASVIVVEHQTDVLHACDWLMELGPGAGADGGKIVFQGTPQQIVSAGTATAPFMRRATEQITTATVKNLPSRKTAGTTKDSVISLRGVREHNLKNISLEIPHRKLTVLTGVSGSGKSSLAFDVIFAEGQHRFMECMSAYARQFIEQMPRPDVDDITGLPPTVAIEQRITRGSAKSTVATVTEVAQYLRLLFSRIGIMHNPATGTELIAGTEEQVTEQLSIALEKGKKEKALYLAAPLIRNRKGHHQPLANWAIDHGYEKFRVDGKIVELKNFKPLDRYKEHDIELIVGAATSPISKSLVDDALHRGKGTCALVNSNGKVLQWFSRERIDPNTGEAFPQLDPKDFSWNSPRGWCEACHGHGHIVEKFATEEDALIEDALSDVVSKKICPSCGGARLNPLARAVTISTKSGQSFSLPQMLALAPAKLLEILDELSLNARDEIIAGRIVPEIRSRLRFLDGVGLSYLTLNRASNTLSGGEAQRIRLAAQLGSNLSGVLYVLDEPSIGLHPRDNVRLIKSMKDLRERGNTVLTVEHDEDTMRAADLLIDMGPGAGTEGGEVIFAGAPKKADTISSEKSLTAKFLREGIAHPVQGKYRDIKKCDFVEIKKACLRNLKGGDVKFPIGRLSVVCGVSGAGKSTLVSDLLAPALDFAIRKKLKKLAGTQALREQIIEDDDGKIAFKEITGCGQFRKLVVVDQAPIGKTSRSTPATYIGAFDIIRQVFSTLPESKMRGHNAGFFSFNTTGGRCETCAGAGRIKLEMNFMPDTTVVCEDCAGTRYSPAVADIRWNGKNIAEVLAMTFAEAAKFFSFHKKLQEICALMVECGLGYLTLGQSSPTLSGGEAQRLKLVSELVTALPSWKERMGKTRAGTPQKNCYILEEPTIGLHQSDCVKLIALLHRLVNEGHTIIVVEHHLDVLAEADWIVEIGPVGGDAGGQILYQGNVKSLVGCAKSPTAPFLKAVL